ncbi:leucine-rich repeat protein [Artemisia annua]|uniref:Leucine-rich repeat protein n=1 Tax=Artemisia annua TaxID=35608 RepID=A0A2U1MKM9_ARTAN|nr:leucine-rich repeat protein [Artemisia annua]
MEGMSSLLCQNRDINNKENIPPFLSISKTNDYKLGAKMTLKKNNKHRKPPKDITNLVVESLNQSLQSLPSLCSKQERLALLKFKHSVRDAYGMLSSWVGNDCCEWERVHCDKVTGKVESLHVRGSYGRDRYAVPELLVGNEVSSSLRHLRNLKFLDLSGNYFGGSRIPEFIGSLKQLSYLNLSNAYFSGVIPPHIGNLSNLKVLDFGSSPDSDTAYKLMSNDMSWISGLSLLKYLDLSNVDLSKAQNRDMVFYMMPSLVKLSLYGCSLTNADLGRFPSALTNMSSLLSLDLSSNSLNSSVPIMPTLLRLDLSWNNFEHIEDVGIWRQCHLKELTVSDNQFRIELTDSPKNVTECSQYAFERLNLQESLKGAFPADYLGRMANLRCISLSFNRLTGPIPESVGRLRLLEELDLSFNQLTGPIPTFIGKLTKLVLSYNQLNGSIPESIGRLAALTVLDLTGNQLTGTIPVSIGQLTKLRVLYISENSLEGVITKAHFAKLSMLKYLDASSNSKLTFNVSREWKPTFQLIAADLSSIKIINGFPQWLRTQKKLRSLSWYNASITGPLPTWLRKMPVIDFLDLSHNKLSGPLTNLPNKGTVGDLGDNGFSGNIPEWIGDKLEYLAVFRLHKNNFTGSIPRSLCNNSNLQILDVAHNNLMGPIPHCLGKLNGMINGSYVVDSTDGLSEENLNQVMKGVSLEYTTTFQYVINMDLSSNKLVGEIPADLMSLSALLGLNLSNNHLNGGIPDSIGNMKALNSLDFSGNQLTGPIPPSIAALNFLSYLNLSHNNLSGQIPTGNQLQTLTDPSIYVGNSDLCGAPLPKNCSNNEDQTTMHKNNSKAANHKSNKIWFYMDIMCGFAAGFWGVIGLLLFKKDWRHMLFRFSEETVDKIYVAVNLRELQILDLGDNGFSGNIPEWIGDKLEYLAVFRLHKNNFTGSIPRSLCNNSNLQILDVAHNNLMGPIPHCLGKLNGMINGSYVVDSTDGLSEENLNQVMKGVSLEYTTTFQYVINMDLSSNKLVGEIPVELMSLSALLGLNLSNNHLNGGIPDSIGNMKALNSLDFSGNQLTGPIPPSIAALNFLSYLNLSHNNLSGQIPTGNQLQTLTDPSIYVGNSDLCGAPLPKNCSNNEDQTTMHKNNSKAANHKSNKIWFYMDIMCGFAAGFWGVIGLLLFKKDWRHMLFRFSEETVDKIYVAVVLRVDKMKRGRGSA